ncbi:MAG: hypothetical protein ACI9G1_005825 [Pirellulaceae bacterium]|jgi:hypothetical protein
MNAALTATKNWFLQSLSAWNRFWFSPTAPHTLAAIRVLTGVMLFYTHLVWALDLSAFLGPNSWISADMAGQVTRSAYTFSHLDYISTPTLLWICHIGALVVFALFTVGYKTRVMAVLSWLLALSYCHRLSGALFGLDQVNVMLAMYLMLGPCGAVFSVDRWLEKRKGASGISESTSANLAIRLIQIHLCVIYLFGGIGKMRGEFWWDGSAVWFSVANYEYQSLDATWLGFSPILIAVMTHLTVFWETFYAVLVWPKLTRPVVLAMALIVHGGICLFLGMITFGTAMIIANVAFVDPRTIDGLVKWAGSRVGLVIGPSSVGPSSVGPSSVGAVQGGGVAAAVASVASAGAVVTAGSGPSDSGVLQQPRRRRKS